MWLWRERNSGHRLTVVQLWRCCMWSDGNPRMLTFLLTSIYFAGGCGAWVGAHVLRYCVTLWAPAG
jgi:hypothetical protein